MRTLISVAVLMIAVGCYHAATGSWPPGTDAATDDVAGRQIAVTTRVVIGKVPPATLVAADSTRCVVAAVQYDDVKVGDRVGCAWRFGNGLSRP